MTEQQQIQRVHDTVALIRKMGMRWVPSSVSAIFNRDKQRWEIWARVRNADESSRIAKVLDFDTVTEAVEAEAIMRGEIAIAA